MSKLCEQLRFMADGGSSVELNYGEDTGRWECSWISAGHRFNQDSGDPEIAVKLILRQVKDAMDEIPEAGRNVEFYGKLKALLEDEE